LKIRPAIPVFLVLLLLTPFALRAQKHGVLNQPEYDERPYHFGFLLAINQMNFTVKTNEGLSNVLYTTQQAPDIYSDSARLLGIEANPSLGFTIGIVSNLRLAKYADLRFVPSLSFGERQIEYSTQNYSAGESNQIKLRKSIQTSYIELPFLIKYKAKRINNVRPYIIGGVDYTIDLATQKKKKDNPNNVQVDIVRNDVHGILGTGFDFYNYWFKLGIELKMAYGFNDIIKRENNIYTEGIDKLSSKMFQISFTFE